MILHVLGHAGSFAGSAPRHPGEPLAPWWGRTGLDLDGARAIGFDRHQLAACRDVRGVVPVPNTDV